MRKPCREDLQSPAGVNPSALKAPDGEGGGGQVGVVVVGERTASRCAKTLRSESPADQLKASLAPDGARCAAQRSGLGTFGRSAIKRCVSARH